MSNGFFENELAGLRTDVIRMGRAAELQVEQAAGALIEGRAALASEVIQKDREINDMENVITDRAILMIATRQPVARDLRFLTSCLRLATEMERVGDQASNIGRRALELINCDCSQPLPEKIKQMIMEVRSMLEKSLNALAKDDDVLSKEVLEQDDRVDNLNREIREEIMALMSADGKKVPWGLTIINAASNLERLGDHATNLAEEVIFMVRGHNVRHQPEML